MIVLTGGAGFIGSVVLGYLNKQGIEDIIVVDDLGNGDKFKNLVGKRYKRLVLSYDEVNPAEVHGVVHCGANSNTLERDWSSIYKSNIASTRQWHQLCLKNDIPFIFFSTAAVYGNYQGPANQYAFSKWQSENEIIKGVILRLFNVYGPNEYHKGRMASTIKHWHEQLNDSGEIQVFENSNNYFRDFIYAEDVARIVHFFLENYQPGTYDVGTGNAVSFQEVADTLLEQVGWGRQTSIPMPDDLKAQYQTWTQANTMSLSKAGFDVASMKTVKQGIDGYLQYLDVKEYY